MESEYTLESKFDIEQHKKNFIHYLEVIILPNGTIEYAVPSHQEKLIQIACKTHNMTREEVGQQCPKNMYGDFLRWLCQFTGCVSVWEHFIVQGNRLTETQKDSLVELRRAGLYRGNLT